MLLLLFGWLDYVTGYEFGVFIFYSVPVGIASWYAGRWEGVVISIASAATWFVADMFAGEKYSSAFLMYWNTAIHIGCFVINAITISKIKATIDSRRQLAKELSQARSELHQLRGWLGICAHCSSVRPADSSHEEMSGYLKASALAREGAWLCPACAPAPQPRPEPSRHP